MAAQDPSFTKDDYCKLKGITAPEKIRCIQTAKIRKGVGIDMPAFDKKVPLPNIFPAQRDPLCGLQLDQREDKSIVLMGMKIMSQFQDSQLAVGHTILAINGVTDFESTEAAENVLKEAEEAVTIVHANIQDGKFVESFLYNKHGKNLQD